jgi:predicted HAD superfamily Cof-like phosphohydrolase
MDYAFDDLIRFERACGHKLSKCVPSMPDEKTTLLRRDLILEEFEELNTALIDGNMTEIADGCADLIFVTIGTALHCGIDLPEIWDAVCRANMKKFGEGSYVRDDGKRMKPPGWKHPDIAGILADQKPLAEIYRED